MLSRAVAEHTLEKREDLPDKENETINKIATQELYARASAGNVLKDTSESRLNMHAQFASKTISPSQQNRHVSSKFRPPLHAGAKRRVDGLEKAISPHLKFEEESSSHEITVNPRHSNGCPETIVFDENDFSDVDLDADLEVEPARSVAYPKLSTVIDLTGPTISTAEARLKVSPGLPSPIVYPTLPRQQAVQTSYHDFDIPPSSGAFDWSSSPLQHMQPKNDPYTLDKPPQKIKAEAAPLPTLTTKRKIPWDSGEDSDKSKKVKIEKTFSASAPKVPKQRTTDLWNQAASVVKEQQKKHREEVREVRKALKKDESEAETILAAKTKAKRVPKLFLSEEQQYVLNLVVDKRESVFFTGSAGTGKSVLLREIIAALRRKYSKEPDRIAVTASTGLAACNIGGVTLHSFSGVGLGKEVRAGAFSWNYKANVSQDVDDLVKKIKRNQKAKHRWLRTKVLIVDEVSMVDGDFFDKLETIARHIRNNGRPFGGIQLVITGDFFQLPPVPDYNRAAKFAFDASTWSNTIKHTIALHQVFRQKDPGMLSAHSVSLALTFH